ncbi:gp436 family protein [Sphingobium rhizovicinum]|uniref:Gp436 family protein n=1 Tax=Sphingobium rhizovicinum TaxID=432308 RepID=A0ABV7NGC3_9SPHN
MSYATLAMLVKRFGERTLIELTDRGEVPTGQIDTATVDQELANTDAVINGRVGVRYRLPLDPVPSEVTDIALAIAFYKIHVWSPNDKIVKDYELALKTLDKIADGSVKLEAAGIEPAASGAQGVQFIDRERPLTPESLRGFI